MLGFVVVSHSYALAEAAIDLAKEMQHGEFPMINGSFTEEGNFGSNPMEIKDCILKAKQEEGVLLFVDLGSSVFNSQIAIEFLEAEGEDISKIQIADAPLVEGLIAAAAMNDAKAKMQDILDELEEYKKFSKTNM